MHGLGTIVNVAAIVVGGLAGLLGGRRIPERLQKTLMSAMGVSVLFVGVSGTLSQMLRAEGGALTVQGTMMMILSLAVGAVLGELLDLEDRMERFGAWLKVKTKSESDGGFIGAFVTASLTVCIGAMAIIGSFDEGLRGDRAVVLSKTIIDSFAALAMASAYGLGVLFSAIPVLIYQGALTLLAGSLQSWLDPATMTELTAVGGTLIIGIGLNMLEITRISLSNMLPALLAVVGLCALTASFAGTGRVFPSIGAARTGTAPLYTPRRTASRWLWAGETATSASWTPKPVKWNAPDT